MINNLISVIIPVYNVEQYLKRCLDTVINQTYKNLEIILIDDGSTDNGGKICDEYALKDNRIKVIHKENGGVSSARNLGLDIAKGDYIGFVDSDDFIENDMYEILHNLLITNKVEISCCNKFIFRKNKFIESENFPTESLLSFNKVLNNAKHDFFIWNKLFSRKVIGNIRFNENIKMCEDVIFCFENFKKAKNISFYKKPKYYYYLNENSVSRKKFFKQEYLGALFIYDKLIHYCKKNKLKTGYKKYKNLQIYWIITFLSWIATENPIKNKESLKRILKYARKNLFYYLFGNFTIQSKCFFILRCVNFNLANKIYNLMLKLKVIK